MFKKNGLERIGGLTILRNMDKGALYASKPSLSGSFDILLALGMPSFDN